MKTITVRMKIPVERRLEIYREIFSSISFARGEKGCIRCSFTRSMEDENETLLIEEWVSFESLENHLDLRLSGLLERISDLLKEPWEMILGKSFTPRETGCIPQPDSLRHGHDEVVRRSLEGD